MALVNEQEAHARIAVALDLGLQVWRTSDTTRARFVAAKRELDVIVADVQRLRKERDRAIVLAELAVGRANQLVAALEVIPRDKLPMKVRVRLIEILTRPMPSVDDLKDDA